MDKAVSPMSVGRGTPFCRSLTTFLDLWNLEFANGNHAAGNWRTKEENEKQNTLNDWGATRVLPWIFASGAHNRSEENYLINLITAAQFYWSCGSMLAAPSTHSAVQAPLY